MGGAQAIVPFSFVPQKCWFKGLQEYSYGNRWHESQQFCSKTTHTHTHTHTCTHIHTHTHTFHFQNLPSPKRRQEKQVLDIEPWLNYAVAHPHSPTLHFSCRALFSCSIYRLYVQKNILRCLKFRCCDWLCPLELRRP